MAENQGAAGDGTGAGKRTGTVDSAGDGGTATRTAGGKRRAEPKRGAGLPPGVQKARATLATVVWVIAWVAAAVLAVGALLIALDFNRDNGVVDALTRAADQLNFLGELKSFEPQGKGAEAAQSALVKTVLVNWGIAAVVYLVVGKLAERLIRP